MQTFCPGCGKEVTASIVSENDTEVELVGFLCDHKWKVNKQARTAPGDHTENSTGNGSFLVVSPHRGPALLGKRRKKPALSGPRNVNNLKP